MPLQPTSDDAARGRSKSHSVPNVLSTTKSRERMVIAPSGRDHKKCNTLTNLSRINSSSSFPLVAQWATSFEKLLQHPTGVGHFKVTFML